MKAFAGVRQRFLSAQRTAVATAIRVLWSAALAFSMRAILEQRESQGERRLQRAPIESIA